jgi:hypothetical protein
VPRASPRHQEDHRVPPNDAINRAGWTQGIADVGTALIALLPSDVRVSTAPPDQLPNQAPATGGRLNLFLYQVLESAPTRATTPPTRVDLRSTLPPLALDLHYLLTADGSNPGDAAGALERAMRALHASPVLTLQADGQHSVPARILMRPLPWQEMAAVWTALGTPYRLSVVYVVGPVLIGD